MNRTFSFIIVVFLYEIVLSDCQIFSSPNFFNPRFITGTQNGLFVAIAFPIDLPGREAYIGWFFEAIHTVPSNETAYEYPPLGQRQNDKMDRTYIYNAVENKIKSKGYPGKECLLRTICEVSMFSIHNSNGIFGDILHILLTPSTSKNLNFPLEYINAELSGIENSNCQGYFEKCNISFLELFSK